MWTRKQWSGKCAYKARNLASQKSATKLPETREEARRRQWHPTPVLLPGKSYGRRAWWAVVHRATKSRTQLSDFTFTFHFSLSCIGEGNGNPLQCSCLENPRDGGAWWAAVYGVAQSQTWLKQLSSSSSSSREEACNWFSFTTFRRNQAYPHLDLGLLASKTVRQYISVV